MTDAMHTRIRLALVDLCRTVGSRPTIRTRALVRVLAAVLPNKARVTHARISVHLVHAVTVNTRIRAAFVDTKRAVVAGITWLTGA